MESNKIPFDDFSTASVMSLYEAGRLVKDEPAGDEYQPDSELNHKVALVQHNITQLRVDAIVNATSRKSSFLEDGHQSSR